MLRKNLKTGCKKNIKILPVIIENGIGNNIKIFANERIIITVSYELFRPNEIEMNAVYKCMQESVYSKCSHS